MKDAMNTPTTGEQLNKQFSAYEETLKRKPGRPKKDAPVGSSDVKESELWREAMMALIVAQEVKHPKQLETIATLADEYVVLYKEKYK